MQFKTRLIGIYAILCAVAAGSIAAVYYYYNKQMYLNTEYHMLQTYSEQLSNEFDILSEDMNFAVTYVAGEIEVLDGLKLLIKNQDNENVPTFFTQESLTNIKNVLIKNFLDKNFYETRIFNINGIVLTKSTTLDDMTEDSQKIKEIEWLENVQGTRGKPVLIGSHRDDWAEKGVQVISMVKEIVGYEGSYIEIQYETEKLEQKLNIRDDIKGIIIEGSGGDILYFSEGIKSDKAAGQLIREKKSDDYEPYEGEDIIASYTSNQNDITVYTVSDIGNITENLKPIREIAAIIVLLIFIILMAYVNISAGILVRPVKKLQKIMEITDLESMDQEIVLDSQIKELDSLAESYEKLLRRLQKSMIKNKRIEELHLQAEFDSLQAKISPHFLSNVLNVISGRGLELGDRTICQICGSMAALLRYSTDTRDKNASVLEELHYLENYFYLLKARYMERFSYTIDIPDEIKKQRLPKLALQQIVENSVKHGFEKSLDIMEIELKGSITEEQWFITIQDNGQGFGAETLKEMNVKAKEMRRQIEEHDSNLELSLGGMGLINLYLRLYFLYGEDMVFELEDNETGAVVKIGGILA